ncbi:50S ribosomal protein L11 [Staphylococcus agnetis]|uniref:50S ribosomal protein L11 n=1 Tax=Staphylococcus agnetis TaxID=985762 RepID=UPI0015731E7E|nr:50S ribosomal protein L11 [Staphylococcus agnetis]MBY7665201.1 50S ribosomal protein L11 [Staphylococcus agnetis]
MAKNIKQVISIQLEAGKASPAPPVGTVLGPAGINIMQFVNAYNEKTKEKVGTIVPVEITVYEDQSFDFITKTPPTTQLIKDKANIKKGSGAPNKEKVGTLTKEDVKEIAEIKFPDLNASTIEAAMSMVEGTAKNMGVTVEN